jgi:hypothetical protein
LTVGLKVGLLVGAKEGDVVEFLVGERVGERVGGGGAPYTSIIPTQNKSTMNNKLEIMEYFCMMTIIQPLQPANNLILLTVC